MRPALLGCCLGLFALVPQSSWAALPPELEDVKQQIIDICVANTNRTDNIPEIRAQLEPLITQLGTWFDANRPENEIALTQQPWQNLWFDDPDIEFDFSFGPIALLQPRDQIYQVVEEGFYYNASEIRLRFFRAQFALQGYLKGAYTILRPADESNVGESRLNTVDLEFVANSIQFGPLPQNIGLSQLVKSVDAGLYPTIPIPGPLGVTGELWNVYIDEDLRISAGFDDSEPEVIDLYILRRVDRVQPSNND
ncbi:MAG: hypothetical protein KF777_05680 [Planctomycetaceae bacterium]|nr:hypothetical protein [Planctomycetaceae bacterium]